MGQARWKQVLRYRFDTFIARGGSSIFLSLVVVFLGLLVGLSLLRGLVLTLHPEGARPGGFLGNVYVLFLQLTDPGNMNLDIPSATVYKVTAVLAGLSGVIILSMLIAFITTALDQKLHALKKGHSKVIESGHTLILGWNARVVDIIRELVLANESEDDPSVVVLSEEDKEVMDDHLTLHLGDTKNTRVVTRSGSVSSLVNLDIVSISTCKSVIVLATCSDAASSSNKMASDSRVIKTILGVMASKPDDLDLPVVAELFHDRSRQMAEEISPEEVKTIAADDTLAKLMVQTSRSVGLSVVYSEMLSFDGCELYFHGDDWNDTEFGRLQYHFPDGVPLGLRQESGELTINPPAETRVTSSDQLLILADDDSTIEYRSEPVVEPRVLPLRDERLSQAVERELIIGWNPKALAILREHADYVLEGSKIDVMVHWPDLTTRDQIASLQAELPNLEITVIDADPLRRESLIDVQPFRYDNILILSQGGEGNDSETVDSATIVILLTLRKIFADAGEQARTPKLISEVMDSRNQELVARAGVNDFIISNRMISTMLAQISEEGDIKAVYDDLFSEDGSEIYLKPLSLYTEAVPLEATFADLMRLAQSRGEVCLGVKLQRHETDLSRNFGVQLIPEKDTAYQLQPDDCIVVLAEDET